MAWVRLIELSVGLILAASVVSKVRSPSGFAQAIGHYEFVPGKLVPAIALGAVLAEGATSILLLAGIASALALCASAFLFAAFSAASWIDLATQSKDRPAADCGCLGGALRLRHGRGAALLNLLICGLCLICAIAALTASTQSFDLDQPLGGAFLAGLAILLAGLYWITHYTMSVLTQMEFDLDQQRSPF